MVGVATGNSYVWVIRTPHGAALVDAGMEGDAASIVRALAEQGLGPDDVHTVLLTHGHVDHCAGAARFTRARVFLGEGDEALLRRERPPGAWVARVLSAAFPRFEAPLKVETLRDDSPLDVDGERVEVVRTPGHTPGSAMFLVRGVLFSGDSLLISGRHLRSANPLFSDAPNQARHALAKLRRLRFQRVADGHFGVRDLAPGDLESALVSPMDRAPSP